MIDRPQWLPAGEWPFALRSLDVDGNTVHYTDEGEGPTLLLVHAGLWSFIWRDVISRLDEDFRCVTLDFPGTGLSVAREGYETTIANHTAVLESFAEDLALADVTLIAHDLGGPVGFGWAARQPDRVRGFVAANAFAWPPVGFLFRSMLGVMGSRPARALDPVLFRLTSTSAGVGKHLSAAGRRAFLGPFRARGPRRAFHDLLRDARRSGDSFTDIERSLPDGPLLTIFGQRNDPLRFQPRWKALFPQARQVVVPKGYHFPMCDDPDLFAGSVGEWITASSRSRRTGRRVP